MFSTKKLIAPVGAVLGLALGLTAATAGPSWAQEPSATEAVSYFNPDTGKPTANPDVEANSGCGDEAGESPDTEDSQEVVTDPMTQNVHTDACLFDDAGARIDGQAAFQVSGVGTISGCPDPDGMDLPGEEVDDKTATRSNGDTLCVLSGYEDANMEFHVRTISSDPGTQTVTFCADPEGNGCDDATVSSVTTVTWTAAAPAAPAPPASQGEPRVPQGGVATGIADVGEPTGQNLWVTLFFATAGLLAGATLLSWSTARRSRS